MSERKPRARRGARPSVVVIDDAQRLDPKAEAIAAALQIAQKRQTNGA